MNSLGHDGFYQGFYQVGATLPFDADSYVIRQADKEILDSVRGNKLCYGFNARQMGKSSLETRLRKTLENDQYLVVLLDLSVYGSTGISAEQWYASISKAIVDSLTTIQLDFKAWWMEQAPLPGLVRFGNFLEQVLLKQIQQRILITIDEIDSVLSLDFPTDDFFALIRACYNKRTSNRDYKRLNFALFGVASPSDLIIDVTRTPFNLGQAIELKGFTFEEAKVLTRGLVNREIENPDAVLQAVLTWSGGQPFLTQRLCELVAKYDGLIGAGNEANIVKHLVESTIIQNWEEQDNPQHLRTIQNRIIHSRKRPIDLLAIYRNVLRNDSVPINNSPEQLELQLAGLVRRHGEVLEIYNPIYRAIFNEDWVKLTLESVRPYADQMRAWFKSGQTEPYRLLRGQALQEANDWANISSDYLTDEDFQFLQASRQRYQEILDGYARASSTASGRVAQILAEVQPEIVSRASEPEKLIRVISSWVGNQPELAQLLCNWLLEIQDIPEGQESFSIQNLIEAHLETSEELQQHFDDLESTIRADDHFKEILLLYKSILENPGYIAEDSLALRSLITLGLAEPIGFSEHKNKQLQVANRFYERVFDNQWVDRMLNRRLIDRYEILEDLHVSVPGTIPLQVYRVDALGLAGRQQYVLQQLDLPEDDVELQSVARRVFTSKVENLLNRLPRVDTLPDVTGYRPLYIVYKEVTGHNLDQEITPTQHWNDDQIIQLLIEVLEILCLAHAQGLAHLNLKPSNIRRRDSGSLSLIDFSLLKEVYAATVNPQKINPIQLIGTQGYIPPELLEEDGWYLIASKSNDAGDLTNQAKTLSADQVRQQWDIYSLGIIGIQALSAIEPLEMNRNADNHQLLWRFIPSYSSSSSVSDGLANILDKMVHPDPRIRYQDVETIVRDLKQLKSQRIFSKRFVWANPRKQGWRFWLVAGTLSASILVGLKFQLDNFQQVNQHVANFNSCVSSIQSTSKTEESWIDTEVITQTVDVLQSCNHYLSRVVQSQSFTPIPQDSNIDERYLSHFQKVEQDGVFSLISAGEASMILQEVLQQTQETKASDYFNHVVITYPDDPLGFFYLGLVNRNLQSTSSKVAQDGLNDMQLEALSKYLLMYLKISGQLEDLKSDDIEDMDTFRIRSELSVKDFPPLAILGYLWFQDPKMIQLQERIPEYLQDEFENEFRDPFEVLEKVIYGLTRQIIRQSSSLDTSSKYYVDYNLAIRYVNNRNYRDAAFQFEEIAKELENSAYQDTRAQSLEAQALRSAGIATFLSNVRDRDKAIHFLEKSQTVESKQWVENFINNLSNCISLKGDCDENSSPTLELTQEAAIVELTKYVGSPGSLDSIAFPYQPMFSCQSNILLSIAYPELCF